MKIKQLNILNEFVPPEGGDDDGEDDGVQWFGPYKSWKDAVLTAQSYISAWNNQDPRKDLPEAGYDFHIMITNDGYYWKETGARNNSMDDEDVAEGWKGATVGRIAGEIGGGALGTVIEPGIGTDLGALAGGAIGSQIGDKLGDKISNKLKKDDVTEVTEPLSVGAKIRTKKAGIEGQVAKIEHNIVFFKMGDGRLMKTSINNVVPVEKLEDELPDFLSTNEGSMGGINRCAPSNDVSYEHVLDEIMDKYMQANINHQGPDRRQEPKPEPVPGLNKQKAEKIAKEMNIRLNDTIYVYKLVKGMISLEEVPPTVRMAIYNLVDRMVPADSSTGQLKPYVFNKLKQIVAENQIKEETKRLENLYRN